MGAVWGAREVRQRRWAPRLPLPDGKGRRASIQEQCSFAALSLYCARSANHGRCAPDERPTPTSGRHVSQQSWPDSTFEIAQKPAEALLAPIAGLHGIPILGRLVPERPREVGCHALGRFPLAVILGAQRTVVCCEAEMSRPIRRTVLALGFDPPPLAVPPLPALRQ